MSDENIQNCWLCAFYKLSNDCCQLTENQYERYGIETIENKAQVKNCKWFIHIDD
jgi:hypothetical protein